jgi:hypothetical protein
MGFLRRKVPTHYIPIHPRRLPIRGDRDDPAPTARSPYFVCPGCPRPFPVSPVLPQHGTKPPLKTVGTHPCEPGQKRRAIDAP